MKAIWCALAVAFALAAAESAAAEQPAGPSAHPLMDRLDAVMGHIQDARKAGDLTRDETDGLKNQFQTILAVERRYAATEGLDGWERKDLKRMLDELEARLHREARDGQSHS
jgi:hypothetical protein